MSPSIDTRETRACAYETKFLVTPAIGNAIKTWARERLKADPNAGGSLRDEYRTTTLYADTAGFDVFLKRDSYGRSKYRIRRYGDNPQVFLERKMRSDRMLSKRRTSIDLADLGQLALAGERSTWAGHWFHRRLVARALQPACELSYVRTARVAMTPFGPIRLTLDEHLRARRAAGFVFHTGDGHPVLDRHVILELKYRVAPPALFKQLVEEFKLTPVAVSKYRLGITALGLAPEPVVSIPGMCAARAMSTGSSILERTA
jgi:VTC domain-containing protein